jgi:hypothetical protein
MEESHFQSFKKKVETKVQSEDDLENFLVFGYSIMNELVKFLLKIFVIIFKQKFFLIK